MIPAPTRGTITLPGLVLGYSRVDVGYGAPVVLISADSSIFEPQLVGDLVRVSSSIPVKTGVT